MLVWWPFNLSLNLQDYNWRYYLYRYRCHSRWLCPLKTAWPCVWSWRLWRRKAPHPLLLLLLRFDGSWLGMAAMAEEVTLRLRPLQVPHP